MLGVTVNIKGDAEAMAKIAGIEGALQDFSKALEIIGDGMVHYFSNDVFASQGGMFGAPWAKLSTASLMQKAKHYRAYANVPLIATGTMKSSFVAHTDPKHLTVTNTAPYFVYHQSSAPRSKLPRRQMMGIDQKMKDLIKATIEADIHSKLAVL